MAAVADMRPAPLPAALPSRPAAAPAQLVAQLMGPWASAAGRTALQQTAQASAPGASGGGGGGGGRLAALGLDAASLTPFSLQAVPRCGCGGARALRRQLVRDPTKLPSLVDAALLQ